MNVKHVEDSQKLQEIRKKNSAQNLLDLVYEIRQVLKGEKLPSDLATQHDYYLWEGDTNTSEV